MSSTKYISDVKIVKQNQEIVFNYLSNFENLSKYVNEGLLTKLTEQGIVIRRTNANDHRSGFLTVSSPSIKLLEKYNGLLSGLSGAA